LTVASSSAVAPTAAYSPYRRGFRKRYSGAGEGL
jgi:hypothetical protein